MGLEGLYPVFPEVSLRAAQFVSLLSVWMLIGLFYYLNRYTKREYFAVWTTGWLFYALWLTLNLELPDAQPGGVGFLCEQWCAAISAVFLVWGSLRFLSLPGRQMSFGLFMLFLLVWSYVSPKAFSNNRLAVELPVFVLLGLGSLFAGICFFRLRMRMPFVGAGMLSVGFQLWGLYLAAYPFARAYKELTSIAFFIGAMLQLFIAVSMIVLVLEEVRFNAEQARAEAASVRSEKESLQFKFLSSEEKCRDLYDQVRLAEGVQQAYEELRRTQGVVVQQERLRALGQMASGVVHDINNSLSPILGYSELLLNTMPELPDKARKCLQIINRSSDDIAHTVARMREFYRSTANSEPLSEVDLNEIIQEVIELTRPRWRDISQSHGTNINLETELEPDLPPLLCDPSDLREALTNLVFNAVDALPHGGTITLATRALDSADAPEAGHGGRRVQIEVRDNGVGMDEKTRQRCFEPFFSTKVQRGGTGLGLAMVYGMMQRHEGTIDLDSTPGQGTTVRLTFPVRKAAAQTVTMALPQQEPNRSLNVLCIDDEARVRQLLNVCLAQFGHQVSMASTGREGLRLFRAANQKQKPYEVVITDLGMPDLDGHQVAKVIKAESPNMPIIMMTGWGTTMGGDKRPSADVDALIDKPPHIERLNHLLLQLTNHAKA
jgi:signal transduction histidine kinase/ActR/RegA family two-component response regulator